MKKTMRIVSLLMSIVLLFGLTACKKSTPATSDDYELVTSEYYVYEDGEVPEGEEGEAVDGEQSAGKDKNKGNSSNKNNGGNKNNGTVKNPNRVSPQGTAASTSDKTFYGKHLKLMLKFDPKNDNSDIVKGYMAGLNAWMKKYNCTYELVDSDLYYDKLTTAVAAKDSPDLFYQIETFPKIVSVGLVQPLEDYIPADQKYLDQQSLNEGTWAGHIYSLYVSNGVGRTYMKFNPDLFLERGVKTPREYFEENNWTWDTFRECAKAMTGNGIYGASSKQFAMFGGKDLISVAENGDISSTLNSTWNTEFMQWCYKLYAEDKIFAPASGGTVAMQAVQLDAEPKYDKDGNPTEFMDDGSGTRWEIVPFPKKPGDSSYISHAQQFSFMVPVGAKNPAMSVSLALSMCSGWKEYVDKYAKSYSSYEKKVRDACKKATNFLYYPDVHTFYPNDVSTWDNDPFCALLTTPTATAINSVLKTHQNECKTYNEKY